MKAVMLTEPRGPEALTLVELPTPQPAPDEVLVQIRAVSLNYRDLVILDGAYKSQQKQQNLIPTSDAAGEVVSVGAKVKDYKEGDRVTPLFFSEWIGGEPDQMTIKSDWGRDRDGMLCELKVFKAHQLVKTPKHLSDIEAACLPCAGLTAWNAVHETGGVGPGDTVLTQGTGGVSLFALQFAKNAGATVIVTSSSDRKLVRAKELGADHLINYLTTPNWGQEALSFTNGKGIDLIVELGGTETLKQSLMAIRPGGTVGMIGVLSGATFGDILLPFVVSRKITLQGITVGNSEDMKAMFEHMTRQDAKPIVDNVFPVTKARAAFEHLRSGAHFGKVCIVFENQKTML